MQMAGAEPQSHRHHEGSLSRVLGLRVVILPYDMADPRQIQENENNETCDA